jgi:hypothetical protein
MRFKLPVAQQPKGGLAAVAERFPAFQKRSDGRGIRGAVSGGRHLAGAHAHFEITSSSGKNEWSIEYEIVAASHGRMPKGTPNLDGLFKGTADLLGSPGHEHKTLVTANLALSTKRWESVVPLPLAPPGPLEKMPGGPQISGIDFSFSDRASGQKLRRAFVTTYDAIDQLVVRLLLSHATGWGKHVTLEMTSLIQQYVPVFVRIREESKQ